MYYICKKKVLKKILDTGYWMCECEREKEPGVINIKLP